MDDDGKTCTCGAPLKPHGTGMRMPDDPPDKPHLVVWFCDHRQEGGEHTTVTSYER